MPIPELSKEMTREDIIKAYIAEGWAKQLEFDWVYMGRNGEVRIKRLRFNADSMPCGRQEDVQHMLSFVQRTPMGAVWHCAMCGKTDGPISDELGIEIDNKPITVNDAWKVIEKSGQFPPIGLIRGMGGQRVRIKE